MEFKQAIVIRSDLDMGRGKLISQATHASLMAYKLAKPSDASEWEDGGSKKITLKVGSEAELLEVFKKARAAKLPAALVKDAGHTQVAPGTATAVAIGPAPEAEVDRVTGELKLL